MTHPPLLLVIDVGTRTLEMAQRMVHQGVQVLAPDSVPLRLTMVFGIAVGDANGVLVALRDIGATEGKAGRVEMMEAWCNAFLGTDSQSYVPEQK